MKLKSPFDLKKCIFNKTPDKIWQYSFNGGTAPWIKVDDKNAIELMNAIYYLGVNEGKDLRQWKLNKH